MTPLPPSGRKYPSPRPLSHKGGGDLSCFPYPTRSTISSTRPNTSAGLSAVMASGTV